MNRKVCRQTRYLYLSIKEEARRARPLIARRRSLVSGGFPQRATTLVPALGCGAQALIIHTNTLRSSTRDTHPPRSTKHAGKTSCCYTQHRPHERPSRPTAHPDTEAMLYSALVTATLAACALAAPRITSPAAGASLPVSGGAITVEWEDDGKAPKMSQLASFTLQLVVGGNTEANSVRGRA